MSFMRQQYDTFTPVLSLLCDSDLVPGDRITLVQRNVGSGIEIDHTIKIIKHVQFLVYLNLQKMDNF